MSGIKKTHWSLIDRSSTSNGMHEFKMTVVHQIQIVLLFILQCQDQWNFKKKKAELGGNGFKLHLRWADLCKKHHFCFHWERQHRKCWKETSGLQRREEDCSLQVLSQLQLLFEYGKCYWLKRFYISKATYCIWGEMLLESRSDHLKWKHWWFLCS